VQNNAYDLTESPTPQNPNFISDDTSPSTYCLDSLPPEDFAQLYWPPSIYEHAYPTPLPIRQRYDAGPERAVSTGASWQPSSAAPSSYYQRCRNLAMPQVNDINRVYYDGPLTLMYPNFGASSTTDDVPYTSPSAPSSSYAGFQSGRVR
jgi:hypothetical protein